MKSADVHRTKPNAQQSESDEMKTGGLRLKTETSRLIHRTQQSIITS